MLPAVLRSPRPLLVVAALAAPLALSACTAQSSSSSKTFKGTKKDIEKQVTKLSDLSKDGKAAAICSELFTEKLQAEFAKVGGTCTKVVDRAVSNADYTLLTVDSIDLDGDDTTSRSAVVRTQVQKDGPKRGITFVRADAKAAWKIDAFQARVTSTQATTPAGTTPASTTPKPTTP